MRRVPTEAYVKCCPAEEGAVLSAGVSVMHLMASISVLISPSALPLLSVRVDGVCLDEEFEGRSIR